MGLAALAVLCVLAGLVAVLIGRRLPARHVAEGSREFAVAATRVAAAVRDVEAQPRWRGGVSRIEIHERSASGLRYTEHGTNGAIPFRFVENSTDRRFTSVIDTDALPFGGQWTFTIDSLGPAQARLTIREDGVVHSALFRFVGTYLLGHTRSIDGYLRDLAASLGTATG